MRDEKDSTPAESPAETSTPDDSLQASAVASSLPKSNKSRRIQPSTIRDHPYRLLGVTVLTLLGLLAMAGVKSYRDLATAQDIEKDLRREISETQERLESLGETIGRIQNDPATLERLAREHLGMVREGDVVIVLPDEDRESDARPSPTVDNSL